MSFVPSRYQQAVFDFIRNGKGNAVVEAVAGSGKTTTILQALGYLPQNQATVFLAFNKDIATHLSEKAKAQGSTGVDVMTLNALGNRAWARFKGVARNNVEAKKVDFIAREYRDGLLADYQRTYRSDLGEFAYYVRAHVREITGLVRRAKVGGMIPAGVPGIQGLLEDTVEEWERLIEHYGLEFSDSHREDIHAIHAAQVILRRSVENQDSIDFDDQFYLPLIYNAPFTKYDWVFIDEAQDVSDIQRHILHRIMKPTSRLIAVGDPCQSIYGFRGANPNSLPLIATEFHATRLPLSISYRCAKAIVAYAQGIVSHIEPNPTAHEGVVKDYGEKFDLTIFHQDDMILCRNTAPLITLAYDFISNRVPCLVKGRNIGQGLITLIDKLSAKTLKGLSTKLEEWQIREIQRLHRKDEDADISSVVDKFDSIMAFMEKSKSGSVEDLKDEIRKMFRLYKDSQSYMNDFDDNTPKNILTLSTIHKSKGLEAPRVFILNYWLMPSKWAKKDWEQVQEKNLQYVAVTRAKRELYFISRKKDKKLFDDAPGYAASIPQTPSTKSLMRHGAVPVAGEGVSELRALPESE